MGSDSVAQARFDDRETRFVEEVGHQRCRVDVVTVTDLGRDRGEAIAVARDEHDVVAARRERVDEARARYRPSPR